MRSQKGQLTGRGGQAPQLSRWALEYSFRFESSPILLQIWQFFKFSYKLQVAVREREKMPYREWCQLPGCRTRTLGECSVSFGEVQETELGTTFRPDWLQSPGSSHSAWDLKGIQIRSVLARCLATRKQGKGCYGTCSTHLSTETKLYNVVLLWKILGKGERNHWN